MYEDEFLCKMFNGTKNIAVLGLSPDKNKPSNYVSKYLQEQGFKIYPVYPKENFILGEKVYDHLDKIKDTIDMVLMFRKAEFANEIYPILMKKAVKKFWLQLGIINDAVGQKCQNNDISFVQNACAMVEHKRLKAKGYL